MPLLSKIEEDIAVEEKVKTLDVVMVRDGDSEWSKKQILCGWFDATLTEKGLEDALNAGKILKEENIAFDIAHTSELQRAQITLNKILTEIEQPDLTVMRSWRLNERHYGGLTSLKDVEIVAKYGEAQLQIWRRSFNTVPPPMTSDHPYYATITKDPRYKGDGGPKPNEFPVGESLRLTLQRTLAYWNDVIAPQILENKRIIIVAHNKSLGAIVKHLEGLSNDDYMGLNLPAGIPFVYELNENLKPVAPMTFLGDQEIVKKAIEAAEDQVKTKFFYD